MQENSQHIAWASLLGKWAEFARSALALPESGEGGRWREAVPSVIALQAVTHALTELQELDDSEQAVGLDRAALLIQHHEHALRHLWKAHDLPGEIGALIHDAQQARSLAARQSSEQRGQQPPQGEGPTPSG